MKKNKDKKGNDSVDVMVAHDTLDMNITRRFFLISASVLLMGGIDTLFRNKGLVEMSGDYAVINGWVIPKKMLSNGFS